MRSAWILILIYFAFTGCKREQREMAPPSPQADLATSVQLTDLVASSPSNHSGVSAPETFYRDYEKNAFQLSQGQTLYENFNCVTCHAHGGGDIGPPLNDNQWIYGYEPQQIYASIVQGRPKGMPAFGPRLTQSQVWELTAYVRSLSGFTSRTIAGARDDHMQTAPPPNSIEHDQPKNASTP